MKKIVSCLLGVCILFLSGCVAVKGEEKKNLVAASFYPVYIFTLNITDGVEDVFVECLAEQSTGCLHDYTLTAKDARLISDCKVLVVNGAGMEGFIGDLNDINESLRVIDSSNGVELHCSHSHHEEHSGHHHAENSHIWMSVDNAMKQVENITAGLCEAFPEHREAFLTNAQEYMQRLELLKADVSAVKSQLRGVSIITFHDAYTYLAEDVGLEIISTLEADEGGEPSAGELAHLCNEIRENNIKALVTEPEYNGTAAEVLARETGVKIYVLNPVLKGESSKTAYEDIMYKNLEILKAVK